MYFPAAAPRCARERARSAYTLRLRSSESECRENVAETALRVLFAVSRNCGCRERHERFASESDREGERERGFTKLQLRVKRGRRGLRKLQNTARQPNDRLACWRISRLLSRAPRRFKSCTHFRNDGAIRVGSQVARLFVVFKSFYINRRRSIAQSHCHKAQKSCDLSFYVNP